MKTFEEVLQMMYDTIDEAVHCSSGDGEEYLLNTAQRLGWVIGLKADEVKTIYDAEYIKERVIKGGRELGLL